MIKEEDIEVKEAYFDQIIDDKEEERGDREGRMNSHFAFKQPEQPKSVLRSNSSKENMKLFSI